MGNYSSIHCAENLNELEDSRPYLILLNPCSGPGKAFKVFSQSIAPRLTSWNIPYELVVTENRFHAWHLVSTCDLSRYRAIISMSGDGLTYEIVNGLLSRPDWRTALSSVPHGIIAGGSGNALASVIAYRSGFDPKQNLALINTYCLKNPQIEEMDLVMVEFLSEISTNDSNLNFYYHEAKNRLVNPNSESSPSQHVFSCASFLSISWGLLAEIDIDSEVCRCIGGLRFVVTSVVKILKRPTYQGCLQYLPAVVNNANQPILQKIRFKDNETYSKSSLNVIQPQYIPQAKFDSQETTSPDHYNWQYLPPLWMPLSEDDGWIKRQEEFSTVTALYQSHLSSDAIVVPQATFTDGVIYLFIIRATATRSSLLNVLSKLDKGEALGSTDVEIIPVKAFRLTPLNHNGYLCIDGEKVNLGPIQAEVWPRAMKIIQGCDPVSDEEQI